MNPSIIVVIDINVSSYSPASSSLVAPSPVLFSVAAAIMSASATTIIVSSLATIIPLSNTQQLINLKLTNMNYLY